MAVIDPVAIVVGVGDASEDAGPEEARLLGLVADVGGGLVVVSQFTLFGDARKGNRPGFTDAAPPEVANPLYERTCALLREKGLPVGTGVFRAHMDVELVNDGPITILLDSKKLF